MHRIVWAVLFVLASSCAADRGALLVQVVSLDYDAGVDVDEVRVVLRADGASADLVVAPFVVAADTSFARPTRVATALDLPNGSYRGAIHVLRAGVEVADPRPFRVDVAGTTVFTALVSRLCEGVACPGSADARSVACLAGRCVPPECSEEHPELCPMPECSASAPCAASSIACGASTCTASGVCVLERHDELCAATERCDATAGCVSRAPESPELLFPLPGAYTASVWATDVHTVRFAWTASQGAQSHVFRSALTCPHGLPDCQPTDATAQTFAGVTLQHAEQLMTGASDRTAPVGHRVYWQVSACTGPNGTGACSASAWSYVELGRVRGDYDGDGYADIAVGARGGIQIFHGSATGAALMPRTTFPIAFDAFEMVNADVDGDGFGDLVVGIPAAADTGIGIYFGGASGLTFTAFPTLTPTERPRDADCCYPSWLGDTNDDGAADIAYAARTYAVSTTPSVGAFFLVPGSLTRMSMVREIDAAFWPPGGMPRDVVMIGYGQLSATLHAMPAIPFPLRIGVPGVAGEMDARAITDGSGSRGFMTTGHWQGIDATQAGLAGGAFGTALVAADFDGSQTIQVAVSAPLFPPAGAVVVANGASPATWPRFASPGTDTSQRFGDTLLACDLDGDGDDELIVGAPGDPASTTGASGFAQLDYEGGAVAPLAIRGTFMPSAGECGAALGCLDLNGDGRASVILGCPALGGAAHGIVWAVGADGTFEQELVPTGTTTRFGASLAR